MKNFLHGLCFPVVAAALVVFSFLIPYLWPPELNLLFNSLFWSAISLLMMSCVIVLYLYLHGGTTQSVHFMFALMLIISASLMYAGFEQISLQTAQWSPVLSNKYPILLSLLPQLISYAKNIISFGFAALGASLAANVITDRFAQRQRGVS